jgi:hypothetical protein
MHTEAKLNQNSHLDSGYEFSISNWSREFHHEGIKCIFVVIISGLILFELGLANVFRCCLKLNFKIINL